MFVNFFYPYILFIYFFSPSKSICSSNNFPIGTHTHTIINTITITPVSIFIYIIHLFFNLSTKLNPTPFAINPRIKHIDNPFV